MNERSFNNGNQVVPVPLISLFAASNEVPSEAGLEAVFDRFLLRVYSDNLDSYHFNDLLKKGLALEAQKNLAAQEEPSETLNAGDLQTLRATLLSVFGFLRNSRWPIRASVSSCGGKGFHFQTAA